MTRGQLRASLAIEALLISLVSGIAGILLGTLFGWLGAYGQNSLSCNSCYQAERFAATTVFLNAYLDNTTATQLVNFIGQILTHARYLYRGSR